MIKPPYRLLVVPGQGPRKRVRRPKESCSSLLLHASKPCRDKVPRHATSRPFGINSMPLTSVRLSKLTRDFAEPTGLRPWLWQQYQSKRSFFEIRYGATITRRWSSDGREVFTVLSPLEGHSLALAFQSDWIRFHRISLIISGLFQFQRQRLLSIQWSLTFSRLVPDHASSFHVAREGDCKTLEVLLGTGAATVSDVLGSSDTLLHVGLPIHGSVCLI